MNLSLLPHSLLRGVRNPIVTASTVISGREGVREAQIVRDSNIRERTEEELRRNIESRRRRLECVIDSRSVIDVLSEADRASVGVVYGRSAAGCKLSGSTVVTEHTVDGVPAADG